MNQALAAVHRDGDGTMVVRVSGDWSLETPTPAPASAMQELKAEPPARLVFQAVTLGHWDSSLVSFLVSVAEVARGESLPVDTTGLPKGLQHLLALAAGPRRPLPPPPPHQTLPAKVGLAGIDFGEHAAGMLDFVGRASLAVKDVLIGRGHFEKRDFGLVLADRRRRAADRDADQLPGRHDLRLRRRGAARAVRRHDLRRRPGRDRDRARDGRRHDGDRDGGPDRRRLRRASSAP